MKAYIISLITVTVICSIVSSIIPEESQLLGYMKLVGGLCIICVMIKPAADVIAYVRDFSPEDITFSEQSGAEAEYEAVFESYMTGAQTELLKDEIKTRLVSDFGYERDNYSVYIATEKNKISRVSVFLSGEAVFLDSGRIERFLENLLGCEAVCGIE